MKSFILLTKLFAPQLRPNLIKREKLLERLSDGISHGKRLTIVSAPAGYGKTTLVLEYINKIKQDYAWISLDDGDNDDMHFFSYIIAGLKKAEVKIGSDTEKLLGEPQLSSERILSSMIINDISLSRKNIILVLDDYHVIHSEKVHNIIKFILEHQPDNLHLIITTREDPPFSLPKLRARNLLEEIRADDLRFSGEEAKDFFQM